MNAQIDLAPPSIADLFRSVWPRHGAKNAARAAQTTAATAKAWLQGRTTPSADTLLRMAAANAELRDELLRRLGGHGYAKDSAPLRGSVAVSEVRSAAGDAGGLDRPAAGVTRL